MKKLFYILIYIKQIEIFLIMVCLLELLECSRPIPNIDLHGTQYINNGTVIFQFKCSSNIGFMGCTVEGIFNNRTHDNIRYVDDECFHKNGKCNLECCECSSDCKVFTWNITILENKVNISSGCQSRIEEDGITYKAMVFVIHNKYGFQTVTKTIVPIPNKGYTPIITNRPNISDKPGTKGWKISTLIISPVLLVMSVVFVILFIRCLCRRKQTNNDNMGIEFVPKNQESDSETVTNHPIPIVVNKEMKDLQSVGNRLKVKKHNSDSTDLKKSRSWCIPESTRVRFKEWETERLIRNEIESEEDIELDNNLEFKKRSFTQ